MIIPSFKNARTKKDEEKVGYMTNIQQLDRDCKLLKYANSLPQSCSVDAS